MRVTPLVESALRTNEQARNSDKVLLIQIWHELGFELTIPQQKKFLELPSPETIRRVRQKIQESGKYPATERVRDTRHLMDMQIQQNAPTAKPERLEDLVQGSLL